jgi:hypothetical protein
MNGWIRWLDPCRYGRPHTILIDTRSTRAMSLCETELCFPVIPRNSDFAPRRSGNRAKVHCRGSPANAVADSGLVAGHLRFTLGGSKVQPGPLRCGLYSSPHFMVTISSLNRDDLAAVRRVIIEANASADL